MSAPATAERLRDYFATKSAYDVEGTMAFFAPDMATYIDARLGWDIATWDALKAVFTQYMPNWGPTGRSYTTAVHAGAASALVHMVDTPELFGGELRILGAIDFDDDGRIVRWVDYWDSSSFDDGLYAQIRTPDDAFPTDFREAEVPSRADADLTATAMALQAAFAEGDAGAAGALLHTDVVFIDRALRIHLIGAIETGAFLGRALDLLPHGAGSRLRHGVGGAAGGAFEWTSADGLVGITAIERDADGLVTSVTSTYDSRVLAPGRKAVLIARAFA